MSFNNMSFWESSDLDFRDESLNPAPIVDTQIKAFVKQGFLILQNAVSPQAVVNRVATLKSRHEDQAYDSWRRVQNAWQDITLVKQIACDEKILALLEIFLPKIDENNGPLVYYSESHKLPIVSNDEQIAIRCLF